VDRSTAKESRWQVRCKAGPGAAGFSPTIASPRVSRGKAPTQRDAERLKASVGMHANSCTAEEALVQQDPLAVVKKHSSASSPPPE
jgi:hypothetical protein